MRSVITRTAALAPACLSLCGTSLGFVSLALQQPSHRSSRQQQLPSRGRQRATSATAAAAVTPLSLALPLPWLLANWPAWWSRKTDDTQPPGSEALTTCEMSPSPSDDRHHPSAIRNRGVILEELSKWEGGTSSGTRSGEMLDIASGTGCHVEAFATALPGWTFQPSEVRPDI